MNKYDLFMKIRNVSVKLGLYPLVESYMLNRRHRILGELISIGFNSPEEFYEHAKFLNGNSSLIEGMRNYKKYPPESSIILMDYYKEMYEELGITFANKSILELGAGFGCALDSARSMGASKIEFIDYDPYVYVFLTLKGYKGYCFNYVTEGLSRLKGKQYDVVLNKGSINADKFNRNLADTIPVRKWIEEFDSLIADDGIGIICPTFDRWKGKHVCRDFKKFIESNFSQTLFQCGYETKRFKGINEPVECFPFTFVKIKREK